MKLKEINALERSYQERGLLVVPKDDPKLLRKIRRKLKKIPYEFPKKALVESLGHFRTLPLFGQLEIYRHALEHGTISGNQEQRLRVLEAKYQALTKTKPIQQVMASHLEEPRTKVLHFNPARRTHQDLEFVLIQNGACYADKRRLGEIVQSFHDDSILGGSVIATIETGRHAGKYRTVKRRERKDNPIKAVGKFFVGMDKTGTPVLTTDHFSYGSYHARSLDDWLKDGKIAEFGYGPAMSLYVAKKLSISRVILADTEMAEFGSTCGLGKKAPFRQIPEKNSNFYDERKVGVLARANNSSGVWQHSMFNNTGRFVTLDYSPHTIDGLFDEFIDELTDLHTKVTPYQRLPETSRKKIRLMERFNVMYCLLRIMQDSYLGHRKFWIAKKNYNSSIDFVKQRNPALSLMYVR